MTAGNKTEHESRVLPGQNSRALIGIFVGAVSLAIYGRHLFSRELLVRDDRWLTNPLKKIHSFHDWWNAIRSAEIPDFQPVRDFSYWLDWRIADALSIEPLFHVSNTLIWIACLWLLWTIARSTIKPASTAPSWPSHWIPGLVVLLAAAHPLCVEPVAWISGRKHLLSLLFTLAATKTLMVSATGNARPLKKWLVPALYGLAIFSQPINILWPIWAVVYIFLEGSGDSPTSKIKPWAGPIVLSIMIAILGMAINTSVYQGTPLFGFLLTPHALIYGKKLGGLRFDELDLSILAGGRYIANFLFPIKIAHRYHPGSLINIIGVLVSPVALWLIWKLKQVRSGTFLWLLHGLLPLVVVTIQLSDIFVADSYAIAAIPGFVIALGLILNQIKAPQKQSARQLWIGCAAAFFILLTGSAIRISAAWKSAEQLWARAQMIEETPDSLYFTSGYLLNQGMHDAALDGALRLIEIAPGSSKSIRLLAFAVCDHPQLSPEQKLALLGKAGEMSAPPMMDCLAEIRTQVSEYSEATSLLLEIAQKFPTYFQLEMKNARQRLSEACQHVPEYQKTCEKILSSAD